MSRTCIAAPLALVLTATIGCSGSAPAPKATASKSVPTADPSAAPQSGKPNTSDTAKAGKVAEKLVRRPRLAAEKGKVAQLFQVPELSRKNLPNASTANDASRGGPGAPPAIRLIGFSRVGGQLQALVELKGEVLAIQQGDVVAGAEVVAVDNESVSFQYSGQRWASRLFEKVDVEPVTVARVQAEPKPSSAAQPSYEPPALSNANSSVATPSGTVNLVGPARQVND